MTLVLLWDRFVRDSLTQRVYVTRIFTLGHKLSQNERERQKQREGETETERVRETERERGKKGPEREKTKAIVRETIIQNRPHFLLETRVK